MRFCFKISLVFLFTLLNIKQVVSLSKEVNSKTTQGSYSIITEFSYEQPKTLEDKGCVGYKEPTNPYSYQLLTEEKEEKEEEEEKEGKKKSTSAIYERHDSALPLLEFVSVQRVVHRFIPSNIPLYKLHHSWKTHLL